jgi:ABC-type oligopeptide transport system ATPase subunit
MTPWMPWSKTACWASPAPPAARVGRPADAAGRYPHEFPGGRSQRIVLARGCTGRVLGAPEQPYTRRLIDGVPR